MTEAKRLASERRVSRAVNAIGKLNVGEWGEALAIINARWLSDDEPTTPQVTDCPIADSLDTDTAERTGRAIASLLDLTPNSYADDHPGALDPIRFDTLFGDRTYQGLARIIARVFEDAQFTVELARKEKTT